MWIKFVVGSRPCSEGFFQSTPVFLPLQKPTFPNSHSIPFYPETVDSEIHIN